MRHYEKIFSHNTHSGTLLGGTAPEDTPRVETICPQNAGVVGLIPEIFSSLKYLTQPNQNLARKRVSGKINTAVINGGSMIGFVDDAIVAGVCAMPFNKKKSKTSLFDRVAFLIVVGILAGAIGGLGVGVITLKSATASTTATSTAK